MNTSVASPQRPPSTPIPSLQTLPCIPTHSADRSAGWNAGWDDLDGLAGTERYNPSHAMYRNVPGHQLWAAWCSVRPFRMAEGNSARTPNWPLSRMHHRNAVRRWLHGHSGFEPAISIILNVAPIIIRHARECQLEQSEQSRRPRGILHAGLCWSLSFFLLSSCDSFPNCRPQSYEGSP